MKHVLFALVILFSITSHAEDYEWLAIGLLHDKMPATAPGGYHEFCHYNKSPFCGEVTTGSYVGTIDELAHVTSTVNKLVEYKSDQEQYNKREHWAYPVKYGDCEDFVLAKAMILFEKGWNPSKISFGIGEVSYSGSSGLYSISLRNDEHAVLLVEMNGHTYVLDNFTNEVYTTQNHPYFKLTKKLIAGTSNWVSVK